MKDRRAVDPPPVATLRIYQSLSLVSGETSEVEVSDYKYEFVPYIGGI